MKISATCSGGFSGQPECYAIDTARIGNGKAIEELLQSLDFAALPPPAIGADMQRWEVVIDDGKGARKVAFVEDGSSESAPWQLLISELRASA
ncbi:MAG: hypothetical protein Q7S67_02185 [Telluria sp.]|nr:hypothetical protein [Telluria sp.]